MRFFAFLAGRERLRLVLAGRPEMSGPANTVLAELSREDGCERLTVTEAGPVAEGAWPRALGGRRNRAVRRGPSRRAQPLRLRAAKLLDDEARPREEIAARLKALPGLEQPWMFGTLLEAASTAMRRGNGETAGRDRVEAVALMPLIGFFHPTAAVAAGEMGEGGGDHLRLPTRTRLARCEDPAVVRAAVDKLRALLGGSRAVPVRRSGSVRRAGWPRAVARAG